MKMIVGLGNPGSDYQYTRHNAGFVIIDSLSRRLGLTFKVFQNALVAKNQDYILVKPQTFMNLSGHAVIAVSAYYKIPLEDILIIYDEVDLPFADIRLRESGSAGGHNGMKNIIELMNSQAIKRLRVGIGRHQFMSTTDYVLSRFSQAELDQLQQVYQQRILPIIEQWPTTTFAKLMSLYSQ